MSRMISISSGWIRAVRDILRAKENFLPSADTIIQEVARFYELDTAAITGQSQNKEISTARNVSMYIIREMTQLSLAEIGQLFGGRQSGSFLPPPQGEEGLKIRSSP